MRRTRQKGFTLIELLVASAIFVIVGGAAYSGWYQVHLVKQKTDAHSKRIADIQRAFYWLSEDLEQIINRPIVNELGAELKGLEFSLRGESLIEFTRGGWSNPAEDVMPPRGDFQRVAYELDDGRLRRKYWYHLDRFEEGRVKSRILIDGIDSISLRFMNKENEWSESWPPLAAESDSVELPLAIEVKFEFDDLGPVHRLFVLPG